MDRTKFIGASEISAVMGLSKWSTPLGVWAEKTGKVPAKDLSANESVEWGTRLERVVSKKFADDHKVKLMAYKKRYVHPEYPFLSCELDNIIVGTDTLVEVKTCHEYVGKDWGEDDIPIEYVYQVMMQLGLSGRKKGWIAVLIGGNKYREREIAFDQEMYDGMVEKAVHFWNAFVLADVQPIAVGGDGDILLKLYPGEVTDDLVEGGEEEDEWVAFLQETKMHIAEMTKEKKDVEAAVKQKIGDALGMVTDKYKVTYKQTTTRRVDTDKIKAEGLFDQYSKESSSRRMNVKLNKITEGA